MDVKQIKPDDIIESIRNNIINNVYRSKEELIQTIMQLKETGMPSGQEFEQAIRDLLELYDRLHQSNLMAGTSANLTGLAPEKQGLKGINAHSNKMLITIPEIFDRDNIDPEVLKQVKFFLSNPHFEHHNFRMDAETGTFYNVATSETLEIRKNPSTEQYEIYRGNEQTFKEPQSEMTFSTGIAPVNHEFDHLPTGQELGTEQTMSKSMVKRRILKPTPPPNQRRYTGNRAAFTKTSFLIMNIITFALTVAMIIMFKK